MCRGAETWRAGWLCRRAGTSRASWLCRGAGAGWLCKGRGGFGGGLVVQGRGDLEGWLCKERGDLGGEQGRGPNVIFAAVIHAISNRRHGISKSRQCSPAHAVQYSGPAQRSNDNKSELVCNVSILIFTGSNILRESALCKQC